MAKTSMIVKAERKPKFSVRKRNRCKRADYALIGSAQTFEVAAGGICHQSRICLANHVRLRACGKRQHVSGRSRADC